MTLANKLTLVRAALGMVTFACVWKQTPSSIAWAWGLYVAATVTDWIDGWIARKTHSISPFGALADPIADKVLVIGTLIAFLRTRNLFIPHWAVFLIVVRELVIGGLRALAGTQGKLLAAERWGKWKMGIQSGCVLAILTLLLLQDTFRAPLPPWTHSLPATLTYLCVLVTWGSAALYLHQNWRLLQKSWEGPVSR